LKLFRDLVEVVSRPDLFPLQLTESIFFGFLEFIYIGTYSHGWCIVMTLAHAAGAVARGIYVLADGRDSGKC
jgi:hypothetical protein